MTFPSDAWLEVVNESLRADNVPPSRRPFDAWRKLSMDSGVALASSDPAVRRIFEWFQQHTRPGSQSLGILFKGVFYFDACFWPMVIPSLFGSVRLQPENALVGMPEPILRDLMRSTAARDEFVGTWADAIDYALSLEDLVPGETDPDAAGFLQGADRELRGAAVILLERTPGAKAGHSSRFAIEMIAKWFLCKSSNMSARELETKFSHKIVKLLTECGKYLPAGVLDSQLKVAAGLPDVSARYSAARPAPRELWTAYRAALGASAILLRAKTGRNCRASTAG